MAEVKRKYHKNGKLYLEWFEINDKIEGDYKYYHSNGQLYKICNYINDKKEGEYKEYFDKNGYQVLMAYSPEREDPGNKNFNTSTIPKLVGGLTQEATDIAELLYSKVISKVIPVSSAEVAEAAKMLPLAT